MLGVDQSVLVIRMPCLAEDQDAEWRIALDAEPSTAVRISLGQAGAGTRPGLRIGQREPVILEPRCPDGERFPPFGPESLWTLGNVASGHRPFVGRIERVDVTVAGQTIDLLRDRPLAIPPSYWMLPERLYQPAGDGVTEDLAAVWHVAGFLLLGCILVSGPRPRTSQAAIALTCLFSLILNSGKLAIVGRHVATPDILLNVVGAALGILVCRRQRQSPEKCTTE
jgi:VanZ family protein